mmetsp:Transcript_909/g.1206  ORF Transcript_909/g.1206 Transcript_909/m.1206 type:complete len:431 (+) Transcript_909:23-1315(+)
MFMKTTRRLLIGASSASRSTRHHVDINAVASGQLTANGFIETTNELRIVNSAEGPKWPIFRVLDPQGALVDGSQMQSFDKSTLVEQYRTMCRIQALDDIFYNAQRQGRISFYMQSTGEEATHIGSASALSPSDLVFAQYREVGVLLWRGFTVQEAADQCFSNEADRGKGRQMPVHYGSQQYNFQTISSPLATQMPQAVGAAYSLKLSGSNSLVVCYFGEGAASEGDFHAALNFSATLDVPMIFFCRNNGYAISTSSSEQYRGDGIISRAAGYGMHAIRVDGNDIFAVQLATAAARQLAMENSCPVIIEAMTYRVGHHSTSDDSTRYRSTSEIKYWQENYCPVKRLRAFMQSRGWWDEQQERLLRDTERLQVLQALETAEQRNKPPMQQLFEDVYFDKPAHLIKQENQLLDHIAKYPEHYGLGEHTSPESA